MIVGIGIDLIEIERVGELLREHGAAASRRVFTERERVDAGEGAGAAASLAARFAAKEAGMKALGTGWAQGIGFTDLELLRDPGGAPRLVLHGAARGRAESIGVTTIHVTLTHTRTAAAAVVILERSG